MTTFCLNYLFKGLISKCSHVHRYWGLGLPHMNFSRGHKSAQLWAGSVHVYERQGGGQNASSAQILKGLASHRAKACVVDGNWHAHHHTEAPLAPSGCGMKGRLEGAMLQYVRGDAGLTPVLPHITPRLCGSYREAWISSIKRLNANKARGCRGMGEEGRVCVSACGGLARLTQGKKHPNNRWKQALVFPFHPKAPSSVSNIITSSYLTL